MKESNLQKSWSSSKLGGLFQRSKIHNPNHPDQLVRVLEQVVYMQVRKIY